MLALQILLLIIAGAASASSSVSGAAAAAAAAPHLSSGIVRLHQYALILTVSATAGMPADCQGRGDWAFYQWKNARYDAGMDLYRDLAYEYTNVYEPQFWYGTLHLQRGWTVHGFEGLSRAVALAPRNVEAWNNWGVAAEKTVGDGSALPPKHVPEVDLPGGWNVFDDEEANRQRLELALEFYDAACTMYTDPATRNGCPEDTCAIACVNAARVLDRLNRTAESEPMLQAAIISTSNTSCIHMFASAQREWLFGDRSKARGLYTHTLAHPECVFPVPEGAIDSTDSQTLRVERFSRIYDTAFWGYQKSGPGSSLKETVLFREQITDIIQSYDIKSIFDIGCGDWTWMPHVNLSAVDYFGVDIVPQLIADNNAAAERLVANRSANTAKTIGFQVLDAVADPLPRKNQDLVLCREVLIHLPMRDIIRLLSHVSESGAKYVITDMDERVTRNTDESHTQFALPGAGWRPINLQLPPFNLPQPLRLLDRGARLWKLPFTDMEQLPPL